MKGERERASGHMQAMVPSWAARCGCGARTGGRKRATRKQAGASEKKRREEGRGWAASGPAREGEKNGDWADSWSWARMEEDEFFKIKSFSKSIFSIFNSKPNSNGI